MTLNLSGRMLDLSEPVVMGIVNATPDSFFASSRTPEVFSAGQRAAQMLAEGAAMLDVGAYSTRPGAADVSADEELRRLDAVLDAIRREHPDAFVSVDTFRADIARRCVRDFGVQIINDISGGQWDEAMFETVAELGVPYVMMHVCGTPHTMHEAVDYDDVAASVAQFFAFRLQQLYDMGVADVILDPGFGFSKTLQQNYELMARLPDLCRLFQDNAVLVGFSRKSMIYRLLGTSPEEALNGTTVLNTLALQAGARILRVHDVRAAVEAIRILQAVGKLKN